VTITFSQGICPMELVSLY